MKKFDHSSYIGYKSKQVHNEPPDTYFLIIKYSTNIIKIKRHVQTHTKGVKWGINEIIRHVNETVEHVNKRIQSEELERINVTITCNKEEDKHK